MFSWLKRLLLQRKNLKAVDDAIANMPTTHSDTSNNLPLDPENDPWGRR